MTTREEKIRYYGRYGILWIVITYIMSALNVVNILMFNAQFGSVILLVVLTAISGILSVYNFSKEEKLKKQV